MIFTKWKLNIELNKQVFMNPPYLDLLMMFVVVFHSTFMRRKIFLSGWIKPFPVLFWLVTVYGGPDLSAIEFNHADQFNTAFNSGFCGIFFYRLVDLNEMLQCLNCYHKLNNNAYALWNLFNRWVGSVKVT